MKIVKHLTPTILICVSLLNLAHADEPIFLKCLSIKDSKNRLKCYDKAAPETINQFALLYDSVVKKNAEETVTKEQQQKNDSDVAALKEQQTLVKDTLKEIKKLNTATKVGISKHEYSRRVLDVASNVQPNLEDIKNPSVQNQLKSALQAYVDANDFWGEMYNLGYVSAFFERYANEVGKYGVKKSDYNDYNGSFKNQGMSTILVPVWTYAEKAIEQAEVELNRK
jgi:hypothetical protein